LLSRRLSPAVIRRPRSDKASLSPARLPLLPVYFSP
jgi:hypothetical protein